MLADELSRRIKDRENQRTRSGQAEGRHVGCRVLFNAVRALGSIKDGQARLFT